MPYDSIVMKTQKNASNEKFYPTRKDPNASAGPYYLASSLNKNLVLTAVVSIFDMIDFSVYTFLDSTLRAQPD